LKLANVAAVFNNISVDHRPPTNLATYTITAYGRYCFRNVYRFKDGTSDKSSAAAGVVNCGHKHKQSKLFLQVSGLWPTDIQTDHATLHL